MSALTGFEKTLLVVAALGISLLINTSNKHDFSQHYLQSHLLATVCTSSSRRFASDIPAYY